MITFETSATVEEKGHMTLDGLPFAPGSRVEVSIRLVPQSADAATRTRADQLLAALNKASNLESVGPLRRSEIYDRSSVR